jgi:hypothetical protein
MQNIIRLLCQHGTAMISKIAAYLNTPWNLSKANKGTVLC